MDGGPARLEAEGSKIEVSKANFRYVPDNATVQFIEYTITWNERDIRLFEKWSVDVDPLIKKRKGLRIYRQMGEEARVADDGTEVPAELDGWSRHKSRAIEGKRETLKAVLFSAEDLVASGFAGM